MLTIQTDLLAAVAMCRDTDSARHYIQCVRVEPAPHPQTNFGARLIATNGHVMAVAYDPLGYAQEAASLVLDFKAPALKTGKREEGNRRLHWSGDGPGFVLRGCSLAHPCPRTESDEPIGVSQIPEPQRFPPWRRMMPQTTELNITSGYGWSSDVLHTVIRSAQRAMNTTSRVSLFFYQKAPGDPALVRLPEEGGIPHLFYVAMPCRGSGRNPETITPSWIEYARATEDTA